MSQLLTLHHLPGSRAGPTPYLHLRAATSARRPRRRTAAFLASADVLEVPEALRKALQSATGSQLTTGSFLGFATGYAAKRVGQALLVVVGLQVVALQLMARRGWLVVNWERVGDDIAPHVQRDGVDRVWDLVRFRVPFAGAFTAGCYAGFQWS